MEHFDRLGKAAIQMTAERLGVDPMILAEWLQKNQLLPNMIFLLGQRGALTGQRAAVEAMVLDYLAFVERETERHWARCCDVS